MKIIVLAVITVLGSYACIAQSGHVGVGTSTPHNVLDLGNGFGATITDSNGKKLAIYNDAGGADFYGLGVNGATLQFHAGAGKQDSAAMVVNKVNRNVGIGTNTPDASARLDVSSTTQGVLVPRMTFAQKTAISTPATGLMIYQTDSNKGFWNYDGARWTPVKNSYGNVRTVTNNTTLNSADQTVAGNNSSGNITFTLFSPSLVPKGYQLNLINANGGVYGIFIGIPGGITVVCTNGIFTGPNTLGFVYTASLVSDGASTWYWISGD